MARGFLSSIRSRLLLAYALPTLVLFAGFALIVHNLVRKDLEAELAQRLESVAGAAAEQIRGENVIGLVAGDEGSELYGILRRKMELLAERIGAARIAVFSGDLTTLVDTDLNQKVGAKDYRLEANRFEISRVLSAGRAGSSVLFSGKDGRFYKSGYAAVRMSPSDPSIVAVVGVDASAGFFARLSALKRYLLLTGGALLILVVGASMAVAAYLTRPLSTVAAAAERIGAGDLETPIDVRSAGEVTKVANALESMRKQVHARDERMQQMLAGIAHEVRNPLAGIELFAGLLRDEVETQPVARGHVDRIAKELAHLQVVVSDFLAFARRSPPELAPVDLAALAREVAELAAADAQKSGVKMALPSDATKALVLADSDQLRRVFLNLIKNALQATPRGGEVTMKVTTTQKTATFIVSDTGCGIATDSMERIFAPFFTTKEKGIGLGLSFAKEIVTAHGGTLSVQSEPGRGAAFSVELPLAPPGQNASLESPTEGQKAL